MATRRYATQQLSLLVEDKGRNHLRMTRARSHHIHLLDLGKRFILRQFHLQKRDVSCHRTVRHIKQENSPEVGKERIDHAAGVVLLRREERDRCSVGLSLIMTDSTHLLVRLELVDRLDLNDIIVLYEIAL